MTDNVVDMRFGMFMPPFHHTPQSPHRLLHRDLELIELLDRLDYDEVWVGEHHSGGFETIASPEMFLAAAAQRTSRIKLATGVVSLPYHHPFQVAERFVLLDHLSRGRAIFGVGPGSLPHDVSMLGLTMAQTRPRMEESFEVIHHLLTSPEPISKKTDWFTVDEAQLQLRPYQKNAEFGFTAFESPFGPSLAGRYGGGLVSLGATTVTGFGALSRHWSVVEEQAERAGRTASRSSWRVVAPIHVAETREQARAEIMHGFGQFMEYQSHIAGRDLEWMAAPEDGRELSTLEDVLDFMTEDLHFACVGTADDAVEFIQRLVEQTGGFGCLLLSGNDWAAPDATNRSLELIATEVFPHFQGSLDSITASLERSRALRADGLRDQRESVREAQRRYEESK